MSRAAARSAPSRATGRPAPAVQPGPYRRDERRKVEAHKKTPGYYRAYRAAQKRNPELRRELVKLARLGQRRAALFPQAELLGLAFGERTPASVRRQLAGPTLMARLNLEKTSGAELDLARAISTVEGRIEPAERRADRVAVPAYDAYLDRLWEKASRYYGQSGDKPSTRYSASRMPIAMTHPGPEGRRVVEFPRGVTRAYVREPGTSRSSRRFAKSVPIHEWAHVFQDAAIVAPPRSRRQAARRKRLVEGGAEAFEQIVTPRVVGGKATTNAMYAPLAEWVLEKKGRRWVLRHQFGRR